MQDLKQKYDALKYPPSGASAGWFRERGRRFECLLSDLLRRDELDPRTSYHPEGEEIDGSFVFAERVFLIEAKWHKEPLPASKVYEFKGKVDGKLFGTLGVFISMSGYSKEAHDALRVGKALNIILFNQQDFEAALEPRIGFVTVFRSKLRKAAEEGDVSYSFTSVDVNANGMSIAIADQLSMTDTIAVELAPGPPVSAPPDLIIVCEGRSDELLLSSIAHRVLQDRNIDRKIRVVVANGKYNIPLVVRRMLQEAPNSKCVVVVDSDGDVEGTAEWLKRELPGPGVNVIVADPDMEGWLGADREGFRNLEHAKESRFALYAKFAKYLDLKQLAERNDAFRRLLQVLSDRPLHKL